MPEHTTRSPGGDVTADALSTMNDHMARFFQHADALLRDWQAQGDKLRRQIDAQASQIEGVVAGAIVEAGRNAARTLDGQLDSSLSSSLASLRGELDRLAGLAEQAGRQAGRPARAHQPAGDGSDAKASISPGEKHSVLASPVLWALITANVMLAVLIAFSARSCMARGEPGAGQGGGVTSVSEPPDRTGNAGNQHGDKGTVPGDSGPGDAGAISDGGVDGQGAASGAIPAEKAAALCDTLARAYDDEAAEALLRAASEATCGARAPAVTATLLGHLRGEPAKGKDEKPGKNSSKDSGKTSKKPSRSDSGKSPGKSRQGQE